MPTNEQMGLAANLCIIGASFILVILQIVTTIRRSPPIDVDLERIKAELRQDMDNRWAAYRAELDTRLSGLSTKIETRTGELRDALDTMASAAEARVTRLNDQLSSIIEKIGELRAGKADKS